MDEMLQYKLLMEEINNKSYNTNLLCNPFTSLTCSKVALKCLVINALMSIPIVLVVLLLIYYRRRSNARNTNHSSFKYKMIDQNQVKV